MLAAIAHPPHLAGICPVVTASNYHQNWTYQGGAFEQWFNHSWTSGLSQDTFHRTVTKNTNSLIGNWKLPVSSYPILNFGESSGAPYATASLAPYYLDWRAHPTYDDYWRRFNPRPDGVFCLNDPVAMGAMRAVIEAGLQIPRDVAIVVCGNVHYDDLPIVPLTSIDQDSRNLGRSAAKLAMSMIKRKSEAPPKTVLVPATFVVRASTRK